MSVPDSIKREFFAWADRHVSQFIHANAVAFHFNLYEGHDSVHVQIDGTDSFNTENYWPGKRICSSGEDIFEVPFECAGANWRDWLQTLTALCTDYVSKGERSDVLRKSLGVGIGFVDGDMYVLWQSGLM
jgi:hypothetical protein